MCLLGSIPLTLFGQQEDLKARAFFEAGDYSHARGAYEDLLFDGMDHWKQEIIEYNIATTLLASGQLDEAISRFETLANKNIESPLLAHRLLSNLALARTMQLEERFNAFEGSSKHLTKDYHQIYLLFRSTTQAIDQAEAAWCKLQTVEGAPGCSPSFYLKQMEAAVKERFNTFFKEYSVYRQTSLNQLLSPFPKGPLKNDVQQLLEAYELVLIDDPLSADDLSRLLEAQTKLKEEANAIAGYETAQQYLKSSISSLNASQPIKAQLFAEVARFYLKELLEQLDPVSKAPDVLENAIAKQEFLLLMEQLQEKIPEHEKGLADVDRLMPELQLSILHSAGLFPAAAIAQQKEAFSAADKGQDRCQCHPWDEVVPLFNQGYVFAERAHHRLENRASSPGDITRLQKLAIDRWKDALQKMRSSSAAPQKQEKPEQVSQQKELQEKKQNAKFNEILRTVQDMENDDRSQPQQLKASGSKREDRPW
jgi:tetratricopeptide (TPR) repeat protein